MPVRACPPLELFLDESGRRCLPLSSLRHVLEWQLHVAPEEASLERLLEAVTEAEEAPLPGLTPQRADQVPTDIPGLELAEPEERAGRQLHPLSPSGVVRCRNCLSTTVHRSWCLAGQGPVDPLAA